MELEIMETLSKRDMILGSMICHVCSSDNLMIVDIIKYCRTEYNEWSWNDQHIRQDCNMQHKIRYISVYKLIEKSIDCCMDGFHTEACN